MGFPWSQAFFPTCRQKNRRLILLSQLTLYSLSQAWSNDRERERWRWSLEVSQAFSLTCRQKNRRLILLSQLTLYSLSQAWSNDRERERWRWSLEVRSSHGNDGLIGFGNQERMVSKRAVPCAQAVVRISLTDMLISYIKTTTDTFFLPGQIWLGFS